MHDTFFAILRLNRCESSGLAARLLQKEVQAALPEHFGFAGALCICASPFASGVAGGIGGGFGFGRKGTCVVLDLTGSLGQK